MTKRLATVLALALAAFFMALAVAPAQAQTVEVTLLGVVGDPSTTPPKAAFERVEIDTDSWASPEIAWPAQLVFTVDGVEKRGYCSDLLGAIGYGDTFQAIVAVETGVPWGAVAYIMESYPNGVTDGPLNQMAIWKLVNAGDNVVILDPAQRDTDANDRAAEGAANASSIMLGSPNFALNVDVGNLSNGILEVVVTATDGGVGVDGLAVALSYTVPGGTPVEFETKTTVNGYFMTNLDTAGLTFPLTITAYAEVQTMYTVTPVEGAEGRNGAITQPLCFLEPRKEFATTMIDDQTGDPRTIGFWKHQAKVALGEKGRVHVDAATLLGWLPFTIFEDVEIGAGGTDAAKLQSLYDALWVNNNAPMRDRAIQQRVATQLNIEWGELNDSSLVYVGNTIVTLAEALDLANEAFQAAEAATDEQEAHLLYEQAKTICDDINNL